MKKFVRIFEDTKHGQIMVKRDSGDRGPEVRVFFLGEPDFGVCSTAVTFPDCDGGEVAADKMFAMITEQNCVNMVAAVKEQIGL